MALKKVHPQGPSGFRLPPVDGLNTGPEDLRDIGARKKRQGRHTEPEGWNGYPDLLLDKQGVDQGSQNKNTR